MKNFLIFILIAGVLFLGFKLYKKSREDTANFDDLNSQTLQETEINDQEFRPIFGDDKKETVSENTDTLEIKAEYPSFGDSVVDLKIKNFILNDLNSFKEGGDLSVSPTPIKNNYISTYSVKRTDKITTVLFVIASYTGGAHGNVVVKSLNFDSKTGAEISIGSIFTPGSKYLARLSEITRKKLKKEFSNDSANWIDEGTTPITSNFETFYFEDEDVLVLVFQPYQVLAWSEGVQEIQINFKEIEDILNEEYR